MGHLLGIGASSNPSWCIFFVFFLSKRYSAKTAASKASVRSARMLVKDRETSNANMFSRVKEEDSNDTTEGERATEACDVVCCHCGCGPLIYAKIYINIYGTL